MVAAHFVVVVVAVAAVQTPVVAEQLPIADQNCHNIDLTIWVPINSNGQTIILNSKSLSAD